MDRRTACGLVGSIGGLIVMYFATGVPIPMYSVWQQELGMTNSQLSFVSMFYLLGTLVPLLFFARISDHLGRRPATVLVVMVGICGAVSFMHVTSPGSVMLGRLIQGMASGFATSTVAAYIVDLSADLPRWLGPAVTSSSPNIGIVGGALASGASVEYGGVTVEAFMTMVAVILAVVIVFVVLGRETMPRSPGLLRSLVPRITLPAGCARLFAACSMLFVGTWAIEGFSQSFSATVVTDLLGRDDVFVSSVAVVSILIPNVIGCFLANRFETRSALRWCMLLASAGVLMMYISLVGGDLALYILFNVLVGLCEGIGFAAGVTAIIARATQIQRAGTYSLIYAVSYGGSGTANLVVGLVPGTWAVADYLSWYVAMMFVMSVILVLLTMRPFPEAPSREIHRS